MLLVVMVLCGRTGACSDDAGGERCTRVLTYDENSQHQQ
jgi:hypothetical protein